MVSVREAQLEDTGSGLTPLTQGWFVVNVRDAQWWFAETSDGRVVPARAAAELGSSAVGVAARSATGSSSP